MTIVPKNYATYIGKVNLTALASEDTKVKMALCLPAMCYVVIISHPQVPGVS